MRKWIWPLVGLVAILALGLFLRTYKLNLIPVFVDEAIYIRWAQVMRAETTLRFLPLSDGKQPLFMWVVIPMLKLFSDPLIAGRVVSVLTGLGTTVGVFVLGSILFKSKKVSLLASLLYALSPFAILFDRMALVDSMLSFFGVWTFIFTVLAIKKLRLDFAFIAGFFLGSAMITKSPALFFILLLPSLLPFVPFKKQKNIKLNFVKGIGLLFVIAVLAYGIFNILRLGPNFHLINSRNFDYVYPFSHILESPLDPFLPFFDRSLRWFVILGPLAFVILIISSFFVNFSNFKKEVLVLLLWGLLPIVIQSEFAKVLTARYIFFALPPFIVLGSSILKKFKTPPHVYISYALIGLFVVQSLLFLIPFFNNPVTARWPEKEAYLAEWTSGVGIKEAATRIKEERDKNPGKAVIVGTEGYFGTLPDGLQIYLEKEPNITVIGIGLNLQEVPSGLKDSVKAGSLTYLVANSSRLKLSGDFEDNGLKIVLAIKKAPREIGSVEYITTGPQDTFYLLEVLP